jgi:serine/threonine protein kinase
VTDGIESLKAALEDRYAIERELGRGGMATVYLAEDRKHGRKVAVKVLHPELAAVLGAERFLREIEIAARLTHPHILPLHDSGESGGFLYYVMPYVDGESLHDAPHRFWPDWLRYRNLWSDTDDDPPPQFARHGRITSLSHYAAPFAAIHLGRGGLMKKWCYGLGDRMLQDIRR